MTRRKAVRGTPAAALLAGGLNRAMFAEPEVVSLAEARTRKHLADLGMTPDEHRHPSDRFPNVWRALLDTADGCENIVTAVTGDPDRWGQMDADRREIIALAVFDAMIEARK